MKQYIKYMLKPDGSQPISELLAQGITKFVNGIYKHPDKNEYIGYLDGDSTKISTGVTKVSGFSITLMTPAEVATWLLARHPVGSKINVPEVVEKTVKGTKIVNEEVILDVE